MRGCKFSRMADKQLKGNINILRKQCISKEELPFSLKRPWTISYRRKDPQVLYLLYWVNFSHNEIKSSIKWMPRLFELLSCLLSSIFPGTVMNLVVHMLWSSPETWTSMHLVVWSLCLHIPYPPASQKHISVGIYWIIIDCLIWQIWRPNTKRKKKINKQKNRCESYFTHSSSILFYIQLSS